MASPFGFIGKVVIGAGLVVGGAIVGGPLAPAGISFGAGLLINTLVGNPKEQQLRTGRDSWRVNRLNPVSNVGAFIPTNHGHARVQATEIVKVTDESVTTGGNVVYGLYSLCHGPIANVGNVYFDEQLVSDGIDSYVFPYTTSLAITL